MPESAGTLYVDIVPRTDKFGDELATQVNAKAQPALSRLSSKMASVGKAATIGLTLPLVALGTKAFGAFEESATVAAQTAAAIKSTGGAANVTAKQVSDLATSISNYSGIDDEAIATAENMLLTFTNVRNEVGKGNDIFDRATGAVTDLATRMAKGAAPSAEQLQSASVQLGKALNDPIKGISALTRVGVTFDESQKKTIARLVETGDTLGAQKIILAELTKEFGGSAKAFGDSAAGGAAKAKVAIGNAMEDIGAAIAPIAEQLAKFATGISEWFQNLSPGAQKAVVAIGAVVAAFGPLVLILSKLITVVQGVGAAFKLLSANPWVLVIAAIVALVIIVIKNWDKIKAAVVAAWNFVKKVTLTVWNAIRDFFKKYWPIILTILTGGVGLIVALIVKNWDKIKSVVLTVWNAIKKATLVVWRVIKTIVGTVLKVIGTVVKTYFNVYKTVILTVWNAIKTVTVTIWNAIRTVIGSILGRIRDVIRTVINTIKGIWSTVWNAVKSVAVTVWNGIKVVISTALAILHGLIMSALGPIKAIWDAVWNAIGNVVSTVMNAIRSAVDSALGWIGSLIDKIASAIGWVANLASKIGGLATQVSGTPIVSGGGLGGIGRKLHSGGFVRRETLATIAPGEVVVPLYSRQALDAISGAIGPVGGGRITGTLTLTPDGRAFVDGRIASAESEHDRWATNVGRMGPG